MPQISPLSLPSCAVPRVGAVPAAVPGQTSDPFGELMASVRGQDDGAVSAEVTPKQPTETPPDPAPDADLEVGPHYNSTAEPLDDGDGAPVAAAFAPLSLIVPSAVLVGGEVALAGTDSGAAAESVDDGQAVAPGGSGLRELATAPFAAQGGPGRGGQLRGDRMVGEVPAVEPRLADADRSYTDNLQHSGAVSTSTETVDIDGIDRAASASTGRPRNSSDHRTGRYLTSGDDVEAANSVEPVSSGNGPSSAAADHENMISRGPAPTGGASPGSGADSVSRKDGFAGDASTQPQSGGEQRRGSDPGLRSAASPWVIDGAATGQGLRAAGGADLFGSTAELPQGDGTRAAHSGSAVHWKPGGVQDVEAPTATAISSPVSGHDREVAAQNASGRSLDPAGRVHVSAQVVAAGGSPVPADQSSRRGVDLPKHARREVSPPQDDATILSKHDHLNSLGSETGGRADAVRFGAEPSHPPAATRADAAPVNNADGLADQIETSLLGQRQSGDGHSNAGWRGEGLASPGGPPLHGQAAMAVRAPAPPFAGVSSQDLTVRDGATELSLDPEELGRIDIRVERREDGLSILMRAERGESADLMRRHADVLHRELAHSGINGARLEFGQGGGSHPQRGGHSGDQSTASDDQRHVAARIASSGRPVVTAAGRVDLRL